MTRVWLALAAALLAVGPAARAGAGKLTVGAGSTLDLGTGSLGLGCADLDVSGTLHAGAVGFASGRDVTIAPTGTLHGNSAVLSLAGNWNNAGSFDAGACQVEMVDGCLLVSSLVTGANVFTNLRIQTAAAKQVSFGSGEIQLVTGQLVLSGAAGKRLKLRSTVNGSPAVFNVTGPTNVNFIDVRDNFALPGNDIPVPPNSVKGPNTPGWILVAAVPLLAPLGLAVLALSLFLSGRRGLPPPTRAGGST